MSGKVTSDSDESGFPKTVAGLKSFTPGLSSCPNCGGDLERPVVDIGVGNLPFPYVECVNCFHRIDDPPVEGLLSEDDLSIPEF